MMKSINNLKQKIKTSRCNIKYSYNSINRHNFAGNLIKNSKMLHNIAMLSRSWRGKPAHSNFCHFNYDATIPGRLSRLSLFVVTFVMVLLFFFWYSFLKNILNSMKRNITYPTLKMIVIISSTLFLRSLENRCPPMKCMAIRT